MHFIILGSQIRGRYGVHIHPPCVSQLNCLVVIYVSPGKVVSLSATPSATCTHTCYIQPTNQPTAEVISLIIIMQFNTGLCIPVFQYRMHVNMYQNAMFIYILMTCIATCHISKMFMCPMLYLCFPILILIHSVFLLILMLYFHIIYLHGYTSSTVILTYIF